MNKTRRTGEKGESESVEGESGQSEEEKVKLIDDGCEKQGKGRGVLQKERDPVHSPAKKKKIRESKKRETKKSRPRSLGKEGTSWSPRR